MLRMDEIYRAAVPIVGIQLVPIVLLMIFSGIVAILPVAMR